jgi:hypothetical protein
LTTKGLELIGTYTSVRDEVVQDVLDHTSYDIMQPYTKIVDKIRENPALKLVGCWEEQPNHGG